MSSLPHAPRAPAAPPARSIAEVERETGLPRATLRIWERRYGFPAPARDARDERIYPLEQVEQLILMRRLLDQGHRPARLIAAGAEEIRRLAGAEPSERRAAAARDVAGGARAHWVLRLLKAHDSVALRDELQRRLERSGLQQFASVELPATNAAVGEAWASGQIEIHEEHLYSDSVYQVLRGAIAGLDHLQRPEAPRVLLTTLPQEHHGLGLLIAQAMFALQGCPTIPLGVRLPVEQIAAAVRAYDADLVGLSFTAASGPAQLVRGLEALRALLPERVKIWAGGNSPVLRRRPLAGVRMVPDAQAIPHLLAEDFALPLV